MCAGNVNMTSYFNQHITSYGEGSRAQHGILPPRSPSLPTTDYARGQTSSILSIARKRVILNRINALLITCWLLLLWWGERLSFQFSISQCDWSAWEQWVSLASSILPRKP